MTRVFRNPQNTEISELVVRPSLPKAELRDKVGHILDKVRYGGDQGLLELTNQFDGITPVKLRYVSSDFASAFNKVDESLTNAMLTAHSNISRFHARQLEEQQPPMETSPGICCWHRTTPIERVGIYIPGGQAPLFSTLLMLATPARLARCGLIAACTPCDKDGNVPLPILAAAHIAGIDELFPFGGAQAIAAFIFGTQTVPKVDKVFGPGNQYVTQAKMLALEHGVAIDLPAGPSEVAVISDGSCPPAFVAADLIAQAEHGADSHVLFLTTDEIQLQQVQDELSRQLEQLPRAEAARKSLEHSALVLVSSLDEAMRISNLYAPEHLIIACTDNDDLAAKVINAGSVFLGNWTPESLGDYASGTNHTLPTSGWARTTAGVSLDSFMKKITFQRATKEGLSGIAQTVCTMAEAENLAGHAKTVSIRLFPGRQEKQALGN
ncbi:MAG: histidinol dehydrogenase [bacterium]|nr:histidinol dehydrogenase [bacterium]